VDRLQVRNGWTLLLFLSDVNIGEGKRKERRRNVVARVIEM
jgi:hypothetical protein